MREYKAIIENYPEKVQTFYFRTNNELYIYRTIFRKFQLTQSQILTIVEVGNNKELLNVTPSWPAHPYYKLIFKNKDGNTLDPYIILNTKDSIFWFALKKIIQACSHRSFDVCSVYNPHDVCALTIRTQ